MRALLVLVLEYVVKLWQAMIRWSHVCAIEFGECGGLVGVLPEGHRGCDAVQRRMQMVARNVVACEMMPSRSIQSQGTSTEDLSCHSRESGQDTRASLRILAVESTTSHALRKVAVMDWPPVRPEQQQPRIRIPGPSPATDYRRVAVCLTPRRRTTHKMTSSFGMTPTKEERNHHIGISKSSSKRPKTEPTYFPDTSKLFPYKDWHDDWGNCPTFKPIPLKVKRNHHQGW
eukprot:Protomagalhaensia_sp_Gyna_25__124@NODE_105_length_5226_cov_230_702911_g82_i0_p3_GENE_NODE_105_length_5226_cov_230_702911_g82_i0NODE_105_length_5226_cov_230_702911_g82_i0_p3_ORF_typecomplete_len246_score19_24_NODE_105_length_5226_cov_230_702911_g82_i044885177